MLIPRDISSPGWLLIRIAPQGAGKLIEMSSWVVMAGLSVVGKDQQVSSRLFSEDMIYHSFKLAGRPSKLWEVMKMDPFEKALPCSQGGAPPL